ncbi:MAG: NACHT domain-containing protein [Oscillatoriales cyanobacterium]|nr:MAG: NACHT domain-containing protein [Oscillatoriales cyanobacterium]
MATPVDFPKYLQFLVESYQEKQHLYTLTDLQVEVRVEISPQEKSPFPAEKKPETKIDRLQVLAGIRKYVQQGNVLLLGKPGSGKSTVLQRFRWELALEALKEADRPIPILVQLRSDRSIVQAICAEFRQAKLRISPEEVDDLLLDGKLLLLLDGVNEMPSSQRRQDLQLFRDDNRDTPMIFTTRDLALGGSLGIEKQLEMCTLTEPQMREFVSKHLPQHGDLLLRQLRDRLREIAETPLLLKMICEVFENTGEIPQSKGELFQKFDRQYDEFKGAQSVSEDFRRFKSDLLQQLAFVMLQQPTKSLVIRRDRAGIILEGWLRDRGVMDAPIKARKWLKDLLKHHLLQVAAKPEEIEFHHQLFQEYYAGLALQKLFDDKHSDVTDDQRLQHFYLNYFKWTEPLAFMLSLLEDEVHAVQAVRVVRLALDVDLMLGARLAGEVQRQFQKRTVGLVDGLDVPGWLKVELLGEVRSDVRRRVADALGAIGSEAAISDLLELIEDSNSNVRRSAADALGAIGDKSVIEGFLKLLEHSDCDVRRTSVGALGKIGDTAAIEGFLKLLEHSDSYVRKTATDALGKIGDTAAIEGFLKLFEHSDSDVRWYAAYILGKIGDKSAIEGLLKLLEYSDSYVRKNAAYALGELGDNSAIEELLKFLEHSDSDVRWYAAYVLGKVAKVGDKAAIEALLKLFEDSDSDVRLYAAYVLGKIGDNSAIERLLKLLEHSDSYVRKNAAYALGEIGDKAAIEGLLKLLEHSDSDVRRNAAYVLGKVGNKSAIEGLLKLLEHSDSDVRRNAAYVLGEIGDKAAIEGLLKLLQHSDDSVRRNATDALGEIGDNLAIEGLLKLLEHSDSDMRRNAAYVLGKVGDKSAIEGLLKLLEHSDSYVRRNAVGALGEIGDKSAIEGLLKLLQHSDDSVRRNAADALGEIGDKSAIEGLLKLLEHSDDSVRRNAVGALGEIGDNSAIEGLLKLLKNSDSYVRSRVADALGKIAKQHTKAVVPHLSHLLTLIPSKSGKEVHHLILAIQAACKYYNYPIRQLSLTPHPAKPPQPNELLAKIDETTQQIHNRTKQMADKPTQDFSNSTFNAPFNFGDNHGNQAQNITVTAQQSSPEAALNAVVQIIQALEKKHTDVQDEQEARNIINVKFKEIKEQKPIEWQNLISLKRLYNGGKKAALKVGEHFTESNPWGKGLVAFIEGVSEDVN